MKPIKSVGTNLVKIASDTIDICETRQYTTYNGTTVSLEDVLDYSIIETVFIDPEDEVSISDDHSANLLIELTDETTSSAARRLADENVVILNFASANTPGGGYLHGARAQEEDLCRASGLYSCLTREDLPYYSNNKKHKTAVVDSNLYTNGIIYSPQVPFFRNENYSCLEVPFLVSVVTCPAPNVRAGKPDSPDIILTFEKRIDRVLSVMSSFGHKTVVLGAWGCGAFRNDPALVASQFKQVLENKDFGFEKVVFAVPDKLSVNYMVFDKVFGVQK